MTPKRLAARILAFPHDELPEGKVPLTGNWMIAGPMGLGGIEYIRADLTGWQPIETAPKDGSEFVAYVQGEVTTMVFIDGDFWCVLRNSIVGMPTHWMPLPTPPEENE